MFCTNDEYYHYPHNIITDKLKELEEILEMISVFNLEYCGETSMPNVFAIKHKYADYLGLFPLLQDNEKYIPIITKFYGNSKSDGILYSLMKLDPHKEFHILVNALNYWEKNTNIMINYVDYEISIILESYYDKGFDYNVNKDFLNFFAVDPTKIIDDVPSYLSRQIEKSCLLKSLGNINYNKQRYDYAIKYYTLLSLFGKFKEEYDNNLGVIYCKKGEFQKAKTLFYYAGDKGIQNLCKMSVMNYDKYEIEYLKNKNKYVEYDGDYIFY